MNSYEYLGKSKLPRGFGFPTSRSAINALIAAGKLVNVTHLSLNGVGENRLLSARYAGPRSRNESHTLSVAVNAVPSALCQQLRNLLIAEGFPALSQGCGLSGGHPRAASRFRISGGRGDLFPFLTR